MSLFEKMTTSPTRTAPHPNSRQARLREKAEEINLVLLEPDVDLWKLRELALSDGGLVNGEGNRFCLVGDCLLAQPFSHSYTNPTRPTQTLFVEEPGPNWLACQATTTIPTTLKLFPSGRDRPNRTAPPTTSTTPKVCARERLLTVSRILAMVKTNQERP